MPGLRTCPQYERLTKQSGFREVYGQGRKAVGRSFVCYVARCEGQGRKFGMAVSRKVGGAVTRNRVKRYLREIYRARREDLKDDMSIVIVARRAASTLSFAECEEALDRLFRTGGALRD